MKDFVSGEKETKFSCVERRVKFIRRILSILVLRKGRNKTGKKLRKYDAYKTRIIYLQLKVVKSKKENGNKWYCCN